MRKHWKIKITILTVVFIVLLCFSYRIYLFNNCGINEPTINEEYYESFVFRKIDLVDIEKQGFFISNAYYVETCDKVQLRFRYAHTVPFSRPCILSESNFDVLNGKGNSLNQYISVYSEKQGWFNGVNFSLDFEKNTFLEIVDDKIFVNIYAVDNEGFEYAHCKFKLLVSPYKKLINCS